MQPHARDLSHISHGLNSTVCSGRVSVDEFTVQLAEADAEVHATVEYKDVLLASTYECPKAFAVGG